MPGKIKSMIDSIVKQRSGGKDVLVGVVRAKLAMKGIIPDKFNDKSEDDPIIMEKLKAIAKEMNVNL